MIHQSISPAGGASQSALGVLTALLEARTGQQISAYRSWRVDTALKPLLRDRNLVSFDELAMLLLDGKDTRLADQVIDALVNQETSFFRDAPVFDMIASAVAAVEATGRRARIWCAGCSTGQEPYYYAHKSTGRPNPPGAPLEYKAHYREAPNGARFAFGHGLTYGRIGYSALNVGDGRLAWDGTLSVAATITNSGDHVAEEVVQLYIQDIAASITQPVRVLKAFRKIRLAPGAQQEVTFTLQRTDLTFLGVALTPTVEPGRFRVWVAPSAEAEGVGGTFELIGA